MKSMKRLVDRPGAVKVLTRHRGRCRRRSIARCELCVGVDLGTTNSAVSVLKEGVPVVVPDPLGQLTTPSVVTYLENGEVVVGQKARQLASRHPTTTFSSVKRLLGREYDELEGSRGPRTYDLIRGDAGEIWLKCGNCPEGRIRPEDISAEVVRYLLQSASDAFDGEKISRCVISVPAYFDESQRAATVAAVEAAFALFCVFCNGAIGLGLSAGLEKVRLIHEPVASALAYGLDLQKDQTVCVFDLGGGTLDICILELGNGVTEVLATGGNRELGGDDIDAVVAQWLLKEHLSYAPTLRKTPKFVAKLKKLAEAAKIKLSTGTHVLLKIPVRNDTIEVPLSRVQLERLCKPHFIEMRSALDRCCWQAGVDLMHLRDSQTQADEPLEIRAKKREPVSEILLVGAATRMPAVGRFLENMTGLKVRESNIHPEHCVAMGAAIEAGRLSGELSEDFMMIDMWKASLMRALANEQIANE